MIVRCITGGVDKLRSPIKNEVVFHEDNMIVPRADLTPRLRAKYYKMCPHREFPNEPTFVWVDGSYTIREGFQEWLLELLGDKDAVFVAHPDRKTIQEEADFCVQGIANGDSYLRNRYGTEPMIAQIEDYYKQGYPRDDKMMLCGSFFIRRNTPKVNAAFDEWFLENVRWTIQDQLSLPYIVWKHGLDIQVIHGYNRYGPFHTYEGHLYD